MQTTEKEEEVAIEEGVSLRRRLTANQSVRSVDLMTSKQRFTFPVGVGAGAAVRDHDLQHNNAAQLPRRSHLGVSICQSFPTAHLDGVALGGPH